MDIKTFYKYNKVDDDFNHIFYQKEYPETLQFYQPFCSKNNITERQRLFYHYSFYGNDKFKNQNQKNYVEFNSIKTKRKINSKKLAIITSFFNPCNYINLKNNYNIFSKNIKKYADLFPIELSFNDVFYIDDSKCIRIKGNLSNLLWQKEALLNIVIENLPAEYTDIAWIDSDILFEDELWVSKLLDLLNQYKVCQLFSHVNSLGPKNEKNNFFSLISRYPEGVSGFAWAARREVIDEIKLLDNQVLGGADYIMASAFLNKPQMIENLGLNYINNDTTQKWIAKARKLVGSSVYYLDVSITHLYHGSINNRKYTNRYEIIKNYESDISKDKIWKFNNTDLQSKILNYFQSRKEDDNLL